MSKTKIAVHDAFNWAAQGEINGRLNEDAVDLIAADTAEYRRLIIINRISGAMLAMILALVLPSMYFWTVYCGRAYIHHRRASAKRCGKHANLG